MNPAGDGAAPLGEWRTVECPLEAAEEATECDGWVQAELAAQLLADRPELITKPCVMHLSDGSTIQLITGAEVPASLSEAFG